MQPHSISPTTRPPRRRNSSPTCAISAAPARAQSKPMPVIWRISAPSSPSISATPPRWLARRLSALRSFFRWLERHRGLSNPALSALRGPKLPQNLPHPVGERQAREVLELAGTTEENRPPWVAARDAAVLSLLYGCGLRIYAPGSCPCCPRCARRWPATSLSCRWRLNLKSRCSVACGAVRSRPASHAARPAPFLRLPSAGARRRPAGHPGTAGTRLPVHHPDLHPG